MTVSLLQPREEFLRRFSSLVSLYFSAVFGKSTVSFGVSWCFLTLLDSCLGGSLAEWEWSGVEWSGVELLPAGAPAAEQPELWPQGSAGGGALRLKEGVMKR